VETHREKTKRTSKEALDIWNKAGLRETRDTGLGRKSTKSRRVEEGIGRRRWQKLLKSCDANEEEEYVITNIYSCKYTFRIQYVLFHKYIFKMDEILN